MPCHLHPTASSAAAAAAPAVRPTAPLSPQPLSAHSPRADRAQPGEGSSRPEPGEQEGGKKNKEVSLSKPVTKAKPGDKPRSAQVNLDRSNEFFLTQNVLFVWYLTQFFLSSPKVVWVYFLLAFRMAKNCQMRSLKPNSLILERPKTQWRFATGRRRRPPRSLRRRRPSGAGPALCRWGRRQPRAGGAGPGPSVHFEKL